MLDINLKTLKIKHNLIGGLNELDVFKNIRKINQEYQETLENEKIKYEAVIEEKNKEIEKLKRNNFNG